MNQVKNNGLTRSRIMSRIQIGIEFFAMRMQNFLRKEDIILWRKIIIWRTVASTMEIDQRWTVFMPISRYDTLLPVLANFNHWKARRDKICASILESVQLTKLDASLLTVDRFYMNLTGMTIHLTVRTRITFDLLFFVFNLLICQTRIDNE